MPDEVATTIVNTGEVTLKDLTPKQNELYVRCLCPLICFYLARGNPVTNTPASSPQNAEPIPNSVAPEAVIRKVISAASRRLLFSFALLSSPAIEISSVNAILRLVPIAPSSARPAIAATSSLGKAENTRPQFTVFALDSVNDDIDAAIIALSAQSFMLRKAFELRSCVSIVDEAPVLLKFEALARIVGMMCSNGMASGIKPVVISQDPASVANSIIASQITNNLKVRFIGAITRNAAREFEKLLGYDPAVLAPNTTEQFFTNAQTLSSSWLVDVDSKLVHCDHYLPPEWLAALANNKSEIWLRDTVTARFDNKYQAHAAFTKIYVEALRAGRIDYLYSNREKLSQPMLVNV